MACSGRSYPKSWGYSSLLGRGTEVSCQQPAPPCLLCERATLDKTFKPQSNLKMIPFLADTWLRSSERLSQNHPAKPRSDSWATKNVRDHVYCCQTATFWDDLLCSNRWLMHRPGGFGCCFIRDFLNDNVSLCSCHAYNKNFVISSVLQNTIITRQMNMQIEMFHR